MLNPIHLYYVIIIGHSHFLDKILYITNAFKWLTEQVQRDYVFGADNITSR